MKNIKLLILFLILLTSCSGFKEAGKVLRNEKTNSTDEFLVKKRDPLILPPDYDSVPEPNSSIESKNKYSLTVTGTKEENKFKDILKKTEEKTSSDTTSSSIENSILKNIRK